MSRGFVIAILFAVFGPIALLILERVVSGMPQWALRLAAWLCILAAMVIVLLSDPIYPHAQNHPKVAACLIAMLVVLSAIIFLLIGWPFKHLESTRPKLADSTIDAHKQGRIDGWRRMITVCERKYKSGKEQGVSFAEIIQRQPEYVSLSPLLSQEAINALEADRASEKDGRKRPDALRAVLAKEITRMETKLKLFPNLLSETKDSVEQTMISSPGGAQAGRDIRTTFGDE